MLYSIVGTLVLAAYVFITRKFAQQTLEPRGSPSAIKNFAAYLILTAHATIRALGDLARSVLPQRGGGARARHAALDARHARAAARARSPLWNESFYFYATSPVKDFAGHSAVD